MKPLCYRTLSYCACATACLAAHGGWSGYPTEAVFYKFEVDTTDADRWDPKSVASPPLSPAAALEVAGRFIENVPIRGDMKAWEAQSITLQRLEKEPEHWVYVVRFSSVPKASDWNGPLPWMEVPVRFNGTVPSPTISKN